MLPACPAPAEQSASSSDDSCPVERRTLSDSGPVRVARNGQLVENLRIRASGKPAIRIEGVSGVVVRNVEIFHDGAPGISVRNAPDVRIEGVSITHAGAPAFGENPSPELVNLDVFRSPRLRVERVRLTRGSSGIYLDQSPDARLAHVEGHDFRGPFPRGQLVQFSAGSDRGTLEDFSVECPRETSFTEDNINIWHSSDVVVRRGLIDGNNSNSGVGVIAEQPKGSSSGLLVEDVDAIRMGNGCFSAYPGFDVTFRRTRCKSNICTAQNRRRADGRIDPEHGGAPLSNALGWAVAPGSGRVRVLDSRFADWCNRNVLWPAEGFETIELTEADFEPRPPLRLRFCWEPGDRASPDR